MLSGLAARFGALVTVALVGSMVVAPGGVAAQTGPAGDIIGGTIAPAGSWDFAAFVVARDGNGYGTCTGSVLSPNVVLTAAHCVISEQTGQQLPPSAFTVDTGTLDLADTGARQASAVTSVAVAPGFSFQTLQADDAILVLATPTTAPAISLATSADTALYTPGAPVVLAGWGVTKAGSDSSPNRLQTTNTRLQSDAACASSATGTGVVYAPGWMICTAGGGIACKGDSGGPILEAITPSPASLSDWRLIGTTSWGDGTCSYLSVGADVLPLSDWIAAQVTAASGAPADPSAAPISTVPTALSTGPAPAGRVAVHLDLRVTARGHKWFRLKIVAGPRSPINRLHVKLQYFTGYGFRSFASLTIVSGKPVVREFDGNPGRYAVRAVATAGSTWASATSRKAIFTVK